MMLQGKTTQGIEFDVVMIGDEIIYTDANHETLTWDNNTRNLQLVLSMVAEIETREL